MDFREPLPAGCPPPESAEITAEQVVFRLVRSLPPTADDFRSHRLIHPVKPFPNECFARGLSVHTVRRDSELAAKLPTLRGSRICVVRLKAGAGRLQQTFRPSHHTWWPFAAFDILSHCEGEAA
jgi:hypothetical protein